MTATDRAIADLKLIAELWPSLAESRIPGTPVPHREPTITPELRAELDHQARIEWIERSELAPGEHPDAARPEVLDLMGSLLIDAEEVSATISLAAWCPILAPPSTAFADPTPYLKRAIEYLPLVGHDTAVWAAGAARQMAGELENALGLRQDGQLLPMICPWCGGNWLGHRTLRVRVLPGDIVGIVCEAGLCTPPMGDVGTWFRGRPVWPLHMWPWLSTRIDRAVKRERMSA